MNISLYFTLVQIDATAADTLTKAPDSFRNFLIASEIAVTAIFFYGFYIIFRNYKRKEAEYKKKYK